MKNKCHYKSPIGMICIEEQEGAITGIYFDRECIIENKMEDVENPVLGEAHRQLSEYFLKQRKEFDLPLAPQGTEFQKRVWQALRMIPYGETRSYGEIAKQIGSPKASRAVGGANNKNHIMIVIPCHRVIGANGALVGFGGGLDVKEYLLQLEKQVDRIQYLQNSVKE